jgi:energy-coupling factor transporter ATP-binding protein EcfA2
MGNTSHAKKLSKDSNNNNNDKKKESSKSSSTEKKKPKTKHYYKLLIVGTSSCGKSTLAKQMKILHCNNFTEEERSNYRKILIFNICCAMKDLIAKAQEFKFVIENESSAQNISKLDPFEQTLTMENINAIKILWEEKGKIDIFELIFEIKV